MNARSAKENIGQVFRGNGKGTSIVRVSGVSVAYKAGDKLELSRRDDYPSDEFIGLVISAAAEYGVSVEREAAEQSEDDTHGVKWCKVVWKLRTVKLDDLVEGVTTPAPAARASVPRSSGLVPRPEERGSGDTPGRLDWDAARVKAANAKGTAANKRMMAEQPRMF